MKKDLFNMFYPAIVACFILINISLLNAQCNASFTYTLGSAGSATFVSTSTGTTASTVYTWFLPGTYYGDTVTIVYPANSVFTVQLSISDGTTCSSSASQTIGISTAPCNDTISFSTTQYANGAVDFIPNSHFGFLSGYTSTWNFGDGFIGSTVPSHPYSVSGVYNVSVSFVSYSSVCTYTAAQTVTVVATPCAIAASFDYTVGSGGQVSFQSTSTGTNSADFFLWWCQSTTVSVGPSFSHTFSPSTGTFPVYLSVYSYNLSGCRDSIMSLITIPASTCDATSSFYLERDTTQTGTWMAIPSYPANVSSVQWIWGDGSVSNSLYPSHTYSAAGMYNICISVTVSCGSVFLNCLSETVFRTNASANQMVQVNVLNPSVTTDIQTRSLQKSVLSIVPNPNTSSFELRINDIEKDKTIDIHISNLLGETLYHEITQADNSSFSKHLNLLELQPGSYIVKLTTISKSYTSKMIIAK